MTGACTIDGVAPDKAVLFCPRCGHSDSWDGGWLQTADPHRLRCPACGATVG